MSSDVPTRPDPTTVQPGPSQTAISFPQIIPPVDSLNLPGRSLVLCFDGTGDQYDQDNSNIVRFVQLLKKDDKTKQMVYYQTGIGTGVGPQPGGRITSRISQTLDTMIASGLGDHVRDSDGDRISLFGFSRGAYTARALAGMLHKVGLLPACNSEQVPFAYNMFKRDDEEGWKMSNGFKRAFSIDVKIDFVGVFDTVNSVGIIPRELPFAKSNYLIRVFRHAVALDERRAKFKANLWGRSTESEEKLGEAGKKKVYHREKAKGGVWSYVSGWGSGQQEGQGKNKDRKKAHGSSHHDGHDFTVTADRGHQTDVKEVWFAGAHCDVGGGSVSNDTPHNLARIPLRWMIRECFLNNTGILFHSAELEEIGLSPASLWPVVKIPTPVSDGHKPQSTDTTLVNGADSTSSTTNINGTGTETANITLVPPEPIKLGSEEDAKDALEPIYDQLSIAKWWWILELLPMKQKYQRHDKSWRTWFSINFGGPRIIHGQKRFKTYIHRTVQYRMQQLGYEPRAKILATPGLTWVD